MTVPQGPTGPAAAPPPGGGHHPVVPPNPFDPWSGQAWTPRPDPDAPRRRRRAWWLWGSALVWLPVLAVGLGLALRDANMRTGIAQYDDGHFTTAADRFGALGPVDLVERWKEPFALGTSLYVVEDLWGAERELDRALELVPDEDRCTVQINRSFVLEAWGDQEWGWSQESEAWAEQAQGLVDAGEPYPDLAPWGTATPEQLRQDARDSASWASRYYDEALEARQDETCASESPPTQEQNQEGQERLEEKQDEADEQAQPEPEETQPDGEDAPPTTPEEQEAERQRELAERNAEAEAEAEAERQADGGGGGGGGGW